MHTNDVKTLHVKGETIRPQLKARMRVQFQVVAASAGKTSLKATSVTMEDGSLIPPFKPFYLDNFIKKRKAKFGDAVYDIMDSATDQGEMEKRIVEAFEECVGGIERMKERVGRIEGVYNSESREGN